MKRLIACLVLLVLLMSMALAQDEALTLRYKFTPGEKAVYTTKGTGTIPMTVTVPPEMGGGPLPLDIIMDMALTMNETTASVDEKGSAHLEKTVPEMTIRSSMQVMGAPLEGLFRWQDGALSVTVNSQPLPNDPGQAKLAELLGQTLKVTMEPTGKTAPEAETAQAASGLFGLTGMGGVDIGQLGALLTALPEQPVKVGDTWEVKDTTIKNGEASMTGSSTFKLAGIETVEGRKMARIEGQARLSAEGQMPAPAAMGMPANLNITKFDVAMAFVNHFDIERGVTPLTEINMCQNMDMMLSVPAGLAGAAGGGGGQPINLPASVENAQLAIETRRQ